MIQPLNKSFRAVLVTVIVFALAGLAATATSVLADDGMTPMPDCDGMDLEYCLRYGRDSGQTQLIPVSGGMASSNISGGESVVPEYCRWGIIYEQNALCQAVLGRSIQKNAAIPVTGVSVDFSSIYWLVVGPAGGEPVQIKP